MSKKLYKSKSNFTLKRLHQSGNYGNIYERDYITISNTGAYPEGQIPVYNSPSFKLSVRGGYNGQKKYKYGEWIENPENCGKINNWTLNCMPQPNKNDSKIILKPNAQKITDYACYGSASELIRTSITNIIANFPAEIYVTDRTIEKVKGYGEESIKGSALSELIREYGGEYYLVDNPLQIDILQSVIPESSKVSPTRYFHQSQYDYEIIDNNGKKIPFSYETGDAWYNSSNKKSYYFSDEKLWEENSLTEDCYNSGNSATALFSKFPSETKYNIGDICLIESDNYIKHEFNSGGTVSVKQGTLVISCESRDENGIPTTQDWVPVENITNINDINIYNGINDEGEFLLSKNNVIIEESKTDNKIYKEDVPILNHTKDYIERNKKILKYAQYFNILDSELEYACNNAIAVINYYVEALKKAPESNPYTNINNENPLETLTIAISGINYASSRVYQNIVNYANSLKNCQDKIKDYIYKFDNYYDNSVVLYYKNTDPLQKCEVEENNDLKDCFRNGDYIATVTINEMLSIKCYYYEGNIIYLSKQKGYRIRPKEEIINDFFNNLNDFESVILNRHTDYVTKFETYIETKERGWVYKEKKYKWPKADGEWNIAISGIKYAEYISSLEKLGKSYDELYTNSIWRSMTHEAITNMDLTLQKNGTDIETPNSNKVKKTLNVIGRQFDEIKKYADNIKNGNTVTYEQNNNIPDYFLTDKLELLGWETKEILNEENNDIKTDNIYESRVMGYTAADANNEFMRRLHLNSKDILKRKGTKRGIEDLLSLFGFHSFDWLTRKYSNNVPDKEFRKSFIINEYVYVTDGYVKPTGITNDEICENVKRINQLKENFNTDEINNPDNTINYYQGLPVAEVSLNENGNEKKRLVPWFDKNLEYDWNLYFQMKGGWARNDGEGYNTQNYEKTISNIHFVQNKSDLFELPYNILNNNDIYYVFNENKYYELNDKDNHDKENSWNGAVNSAKIEACEKIIDNNKGNNPHTGDYDRGLSYLQSYANLFGKSSFNEDIQNKNYGFNIRKQIDSTKCQFFDDIELNEENTNPLRGRNYVTPHDLFKEEIGETKTYNDVSSFSIINSKELRIIFDKKYRNFIEKDVLPYLKQIIPSTTIFSYGFKNITSDFKDEEIYDAQNGEVICDNGTCPIMGVI